MNATFWLRTQAGSAGLMDKGYANGACPVCVGGLVSTYLAIHAGFH